MFKEKIKNIVLSIPAFKQYYLNRNEKNGTLIKVANLNFEQSNKVFLDNPITKNIRVGLVKDHDDYYGYVNGRAYYPKYERFLKNNSINYDFFDIHMHDWIERARMYNIVIWATHSSPEVQTEAMQKIYILEKMGIKCMPSFDEIFKDEDKVEMHFFYKTKNLPEIPTFVSYSKADAIVFANATNYPIVSKITTGSSSYGVEILKSKKEAKKLINKIFSEKGRKTYWKYLRQKGYVYFQKFIDDAEFDLRVIVVGNSLFGYYRYPNSGDFRASGSGNVEKKAIPESALDIAWETKMCYNSYCLATDFVYSPKEDKYYIIESSLFIGVETDMQLMVDGLPGRYIRSSDGVYSFEEGKYWIQELALKTFFESVKLKDIV